MNAQTLADALGITLARAQQWADPLNAAMARYEINTPQRIAAFLAQVGEESGLLSAVYENLNYSASGLRAIFPKYFTDEQAAAYARRPVAIANRVYANRHGNGNEQSGDGFRYRGRGLIQITFRDNYKACGAGLGLSLESDPDRLLQADAAALSAAWYWNDRKLNSLADVADMVGITKAINGGLNGFQQRLDLYHRALPVIEKGA